jgi:molecular chaperone IbpA
MPDIFDHIYRSTIGFDQLRNFMDRIDTSNYPPYNIVKDEDTSEYQLSMAVAGFAKNDISVYLENDTLVVKGERVINPEDERITMLYRGLAFRNFERTWRLGDSIEIKSVSLVNGILTITMCSVESEAKRKNFDIN